MKRVLYIDAPFGISGDMLVAALLDMGYFADKIYSENVRVAIDAPRHVKIYRGEIYRAIKDENRNAAAAPADFDLSQALPEKN